MTPVPEIGLVLVSPKRTLAVKVMALVGEMGRFSVMMAETVAVRQMLGTTQPMTEVTGIVITTVGGSKPMTVTRIKVAWIVIMPPRRGTAMTDSGVMMGPEKIAQPVIVTVQV